MNKQYHLDYSKKHYQNNKEKYKKYNEEYRELNKEYFQKYRDENRSVINTKFINYYQNNKDKIQEKNNNWREKNIEKHREYNKKSAKKDRQNNPHKYRWRYLLRNTLKKLGKKKENKTIELLGYSPIELKNFLESLDNKWFEYEIDHKIPITWFISETPPSVVNDFRNLQLLNKSPNSSKRNFYMDDVSKEFWVEIKCFIKKEFYNEK